MKKEEVEALFEIAKTRTQVSNRILKDFNDGKTIDFAVDFLKEMDIAISNDNLYSAIQRIVILKEDGIINIFKSNNMSEEEIEDKLIKAYHIVIKYQEKEDIKILNQIKTNSIITAETKKIIEILYLIIQTHNKMYIRWYSEVVLYNKKMVSSYSSEKDALKYLEKNKLFDYIRGSKYDCSYSSLVGTETGHMVITYGEMFKSELSELTSQINKYISSILTPNKIEKEYIDYLTQFLITFNNKEINVNLKEWENLDIEWMNLSSPLQVVHSMEYYEDSLRNSVSIDFDIRIDDPTKNTNDTDKIVLEMMENYILDNHEGKLIELTKIVKNNIKKVQLHIGELLFYSGGEMRGLMSAQVIPNNEEVSTKKGKKIFAFMEKGYEAELNRPKMKLRYEVFDNSYIEEEDKILKDKLKWEEIYDITTIGHEYGHVLWKGEDTELAMSKSNIFKNIEEFKASAGGVVSFFNSKNENRLWKEILLNTISRAIKLVAWKEVGEVEPYYCESIITLNILQVSNVISFKDNKINIKYDHESYMRFKKEYTMEYYKLIEHYLRKEDAKNYLNIHAKKEEDGYYMSTNLEVKKLQDYYFSQYRTIGNELY